MLQIPRECAKDGTRKTEREDGARVREVCARAEIRGAKGVNIARGEGRGGRQSERQDERVRTG